MVGIVNPNPEPIKRAIARIRRANSAGVAVVGAGFLVSEGCVLTCAHVVTEALGLPRNEPNALDRLVDLDLIDSDGQFIPFKAQVVFWSPVNPGKQGEDIAGLMLEGDIPDECQFLTFSYERQFWKHSFGTFGFPSGHDQGVWAHGELLGARGGDGWVQMEAIKAQGYPIQPGFSGSPIWDEELGVVVGMAVAAERKREEARTAFMIPAEILKVAVESLKLIEILSPIYDHSDRLIYSAFRAICPDRWSRPLPQTLAQIVADLWDIPKGNEKYSRIVLFMGILIRDCPMDMPLLKQWVRSQGHHLQDLLKAIPADRQVSEMSYLVIKVGYFGVKADQEKYHIQAWFAPSADLAYQQLEVPHNSEGKTEFALDTIPDLINCFWEQVSKFRDLTIEFFLPVALLNQAFDVCELKAVEGVMRKTIMGRRYQVSVRSLERLTVPYVNCKRKIWEEKWQIVSHPDRSRRSIDICIEGNGVDYDELVEQLEQDGVVGVYSTQIPDSNGLQDIFDAILHSGTPVGLWLRDCPSQCNSHEELVQRLDCCVNELPQRVKQVRKEARSHQPEAHIGHHLSLLWEDPNRIPANIQYTNRKL
jgi:hypothetical protein